MKISRSTDAATAPDRFMAHIAMQEMDEGGSIVAWGRQVTDEEYGAEPASS
jgi:hypothetical protein